MIPDTARQFEQAAVIVHSEIKSEAMERSRALPRINQGRSPKRLNVEKRARGTHKKLKLLDCDENMMVRTHNSFVLLLNLQNPRVSPASAISRTSQTKGSPTNDAELYVSTNLKCFIMRDLIHLRQIRSEAQKAYNAAN